MIPTAKKYPRVLRLGSLQRNVTYREVLLELECLKCRIPILILEIKPHNMLVWEGYAN